VVEGVRSTFPADVTGGSDGASVAEVDLETGLAKYGNRNNSHSVHNISSLCDGFTLPPLALAGQATFGRPSQRGISLRRIQQSYNFVVSLLPSPERLL